MTWRNLREKKFTTRFKKKKFHSSWNNWFAQRLKRASHQGMVGGRDFSKIQKKRIGYSLKIQKENKLRVFFFKAVEE